MMTLSIQIETFHSIRERTCFSAAALSGLSFGILETLFTYTNVKESHFCTLHLNRTLRHLKLSNNVAQCILIDVEVRAILVIPRDVVVVSSFIEVEYNV